MERLDRLPEKGLDKTEILEEMERLATQDVDFKGGKVWSLVYHAGEEHTEFLKKAFGLFFETNGLNPLAFKSLKRFESDVVRMTADMLHGDSNVVGTMTAGGTESIFLALKTYRDWARKKRPWAIRPKVIAPKSVHVAFGKAAHYLGLRLVHAPLKADFTVDVKAVKRMIDSQTILIVGSAPNYPYGVVDPIEELAELAASKGLPMHVDACLGGFMLPFLEDLGYPVPPFDFRVPGVTSISADVHKYGYGAKGASVILYRSMDFLEHQFYVDVDWVGGLFASAGFLGTRPGGSWAAAWAAMLSFGREGYKEMARRTMETTNLIKKGISEIDNLYILGNPVMSVLAYASRDPELDMYAVGDELEARGWHVDRLQWPRALHIMVSAVHEKVAKRYVEDLKEAVQEVRRHPEKARKGSAPMYGLMAEMPLRGMVKSNVIKILKQMYGPQGEIPDLSAEGDVASNPLVSLGIKAMEVWKGIKKRLGR